MLSATSILLVGLSFFLPSHQHITKLETSHRSFQIGMKNVAKAYAIAHAEDRSSAFKLSTAFNAVCERLGFLRDHLDLGQLESTMLEVASQMNDISTELAAIYSDRKIERARTVLKERQHEIDEFNLRLGEAKFVSTELEGCLGQVEMDKTVARAEIDRLVDDLPDALPALGIEVAAQTPEDTVIALPHASE